MPPRARRRGPLLDRGGDLAGEVFPAAPAVARRPLERLHLVLRVVELLLRVRDAAVERLAVVLLRRLHLRLLERLELEQLDLRLVELDAPLGGLLGGPARLAELLHVVGARLGGLHALLGALELLLRGLLLLLRRLQLLRGL